MSRLVTLLQLRTDVADRCDITGAVGASQRYTPTALNRLINQSVNRFRERLSGEGATHFLVAATGSLPVGATSPYPFGVLDLSAVSPGVVRTYGLDVTVNGVVYTLKHVPFTARADYGGPLCKSVPQAWAHYQTSKIAILPPSDSAYTYVAWYLPVLTDMSLDADTFDGVSGWEEYVIWDVTLKLIVKDQYPQAFGIASAERDLCWQDIFRNAIKVSSSGGAVVGRDSMGRGLMSSRSRILPPP